MGIVEDVAVEMKFGKGRVEDLTEIFLNLSLRTTNDTMTRLDLQENKPLLEAYEKCLLRARSLQAA